MVLSHGAKAIEIEDVEARVAEPERVVAETKEDIARSTVINEAPSVSTTRNT
jgi:hypothetical protein